MHHTTPQLAGLVCSQQASSQVPAHAVGCFKMHAGHALSLTPNAPGELRIAHGRVWVTFGNAANDTTALAGDHFLRAGDVLRLLPGQQLVMETYAQQPVAKPDAAVYFSWEPDAAMSRAASDRRLLHAPAEVRQPLLDLGAALHQAGWALGRLVQGLAAYVACTLTLKRGSS